MKMHRCDGNATMFEQIDKLNTTPNLACGRTITTVAKLCSPGTLLKSVSLTDYTQLSTTVTVPLFKDC